MYIPFTLTRNAEYKSTKLGVLPLLNDIRKDVSYRRIPKHEDKLLKYCPFVAV